MLNFILWLQDFSALLVAFGTLTLALVTAVVLIITIRWNKRNEEMRVLPILILEAKFSYPDYWEGASPGWVKEFGLSIQNRGFGPALKYEIEAKQGDLPLTGNYLGHSGNRLICPALPVGQYHYPSFFHEESSNPPQEKYEPFYIYVKCFSVTGKAVEYWYEMLFEGTPEKNVFVPLGRPRVKKVKGLSGRKRILQTTLSQTP